MHIVTGEIRKEPRVLDNGTYVIEMAESFKDRDDKRQYTNYTFFFGVKSEGLRKWYAEAFQVGKVISVSFDTAKIVSREHNGNTYLSIQPAGFANLIFSQFGGGQQQSQGNGNGWGQPQQPQQQQQRQQGGGNQSNRGSNEPPMDFDDDIPFAPIGLQYGMSKIYAL